MNTSYDFNEQGPKAEERIVYVRPVEVAGLPAKLQKHADGAEWIYAVHDADGARLALVADRELAFNLARENDLTPVSAH